MRPNSLIKAMEADAAVQSESGNEKVSKS
jgi:hypothetical protein